ncbi:MAG TPA: BadF/BadG/BcrA/BcrD ATPase family protein [Symbiobacteriaceae bacterium]|nr:BadF/BadG/BcrA/BcrD ATPase family protein [Symbiobacteriaceae bacterium]
MLDQILLGIDGGGTNTRCLVADMNGKILGEGRSGPSNYQSVGQERASAHLQAAVEGALAAVGLTLADLVAAEPGGSTRLAAACAGLAGVGRPEDQAVAREMLAFLGQAPLLAVSDARIAAAGALEGSPGVNLIAGTGSIAFGIRPDGEVVRAGGWGWILGDEGSGFSIGRAAIQAALGAQDGSVPPTTLTAAICGAWELERIDQLIRKVYADPAASRIEIAGLAPLVVAAAEAGDEPAQAILSKAGTELGGLAVTALRRLDLPEGAPQIVALTGSVATRVQLVRTALQEHLACHAPGAQLIDPRRGPGEGAILMAQALIATR